MRHLEIAGYFEHADFKTPEAAWTLRLHFVEAYGDGKGYQFTADFIAVPPDRTVTNVTVRVPDSDSFPRDRVIAALHDQLAAGTMERDSTVTLAAPHA